MYVGTFEKDTEGADGDATAGQEDRQWEFILLPSICPLAHDAFSVHSGTKYKFATRAE